MEALAIFLIEFLFFSFSIQQVKLCLFALEDIFKYFAGRLKKDYRIVGLILVRIDIFYIVDKYLRLCAIVVCARFVLQDAILLTGFDKSHCLCSILGFEGGTNGFVLLLCMDSCGCQTTQNEYQDEMKTSGDEHN